MNHTPPKLETMKLSELAAHLDNARIYTATDLKDLQESLTSFGQMEPVAVTKDNLIISGHRRVAAMKNLGWDECEVRVVEPENEVIALIEYNRHRQKTASDILNEARYLEKELRKRVTKGRSESAANEGKRKGERVRTAVEVSKRLGVGTTKMKQLMSISNYEPDLIEKIDRGELSITAAYELVRTKHIQKNKTSDSRDEFRSSFLRLIKHHEPSLKEMNETIRQVYPYSLETTGVTEVRRKELVDHLERLKNMDSRELMLVQKQDECLWT